MVWFKVDDRIGFHRKTVRAGNEAVGAWVRAGAWSSAPENLTEGWIPSEVAHLIAPAEVWERLRVAGFVEPSDGREGYQIHDFLNYNPSAEKVRAKQELHRERTRRWRDGKRDASRDASVTHDPVPDPDPIDESRARMREEQEECQNGKGHSDNCNIDHKEVGEGPSADGDDHDPGLERLSPDGHGAEGVGGRPGRETGEGGSSEMCGVRVGDQDADLDRGGTGLHGGDAARRAVHLTPGRAPEPPEDPEGLLGVLARLVAEGQPWARDVEAWRQENTGRALTEGHRKVLRKERDRQARARPAITTQDEADARAMAEAYVDGHRRIIKDRGYVALQSHMADAIKLLPDARRLAERARRGEWAPTPAEVVAHKLESYMRNTKWGPEFAFRFLFDRTEQDDLPRPKATLPEARAAPPKLQRILPTEEERAEIEKRKEDIGRIGLGPTPKRRK